MRKRNCLQTGVETAGHNADEITAICRDANYDDRCAGLVVWLHTFSGQNVDQRPDHAQRTVAAIPTASLTRRCRRDSIDMDFMNLNQTAHGGGESASLVRVCVGDMPSLPVTGQMTTSHEHRLVDRQAVSEPDCYSSMRVSVLAITCVK
ncbi:hypothetical protein ACNKHU_00380 [Shigella flexneri]